MIVVDSSAWIDFLKDRRLAHVDCLRRSLGVEEIVVGDLMLCEVLQGLPDERAATSVEGLLRRFEIVPMVGEDTAILAAANHRTLRRRGVTIRKTVDLLIGTWCIAHSQPRPHDDGDFRPMARYLGLQEVAGTR